MLTILINGIIYQIGQPLPDKITSLSISCHQGLKMVGVPRDQVNSIKNWLNTVVERLDCEYITYNDILMPPADLRKFDDV